MGRRVRARDRDRSDHRRLPARALLVGIGLHRERADRDRRPDPRLLPHPRVEGPVARRARPGRRGAVDRRARHDPVGRHRGAVQGVDLDHRSSPRSRSASSSSARSSRGSCTRRHPMLDMRFFENPRFSAASGAITLVFLALFGTLFLMTQYLQSVLGYSTVKAGAVLLPQADHDDDLRSAVTDLGAALRQQDRRRRRSRYSSPCRSCSSRRSSRTAARCTSSG